MTAQSHLSLALSRPTGGKSESQVQLGTGHHFPEPDFHVGSLLTLPEGHGETHSPTAWSRAQVRTPPRPHTPCAWLGAGGTPRSEQTPLLRKTH